mgnify:CR=1 FL=1
MELVKELPEIFEEFAEQRQKSFFSKRLPFILERDKR